MADDENGGASTAAEAAESGKGGKEKAKKREKSSRSHADRAMGNLRAAKRLQREVSDPAGRAELLLAEANVLALLDVADALGENSASDGNSAGA